ncbi:uncharacterized protein LOC131322130 [Rhododendron vialii]|uniref:uncharacterized protein LOC131322130 n=1 Tax=Rhododendron vialii TaxID=182163 RepID=UPI00265EC60B|nr:uncharacterized protein LOC131322130 [Rhododendron vialii]XP_058209297.1 uncharacterized protein LOC131322130 [Rhododendron vialii]XP_058209298.1 uncharacterized protein LOC131322130 [Rhododendron vialii]XP_058209300.1 uncharacterized protein LOC131322130 [Rhododendron vialii]
MRTIELGSHIGSNISLANNQPKLHTKPVLSWKPAEMPHAVAVPPYFLTVRCAAGNPPSKRTNAKSKKTRTQKSGGPSSVGFGPRWQCVEGCGACCKLDKGPSFATPEEIFENPSDIELYRSLVGADGWCINYNKSSRTCSIYADRPYFCRVEPEIFETLYGINKKRFDKEACSCCRDTIRDVYGSKSKELENFNHATRSTTSG